ncbi:MAG: CPBP family intramembrane metalloprotease [Clostridia bacterium]|nr:CPBP family intramembrane metalloprotease [Clostridia bacterium]
MKKLYEKSELLFALVMITLYVVLFSASDSLSELLGVQKLITAIAGSGLSLVLLFCLCRRGLCARYGLVKGTYEKGAYLYFFPLALMVSVNLWGGVQMNMTVTESVCYVIAMFCVGFLEEVIFRGFLFRAMAKDNVTSAVIVSSVTFGIGHIVNLLNGAEVLPTLLQICYACAAGFLFVVIFIRSGSLVPCIVTHCAINALSAFAVERGNAFSFITAGVLTVVSAVYAVWILHRTPKKSL